MKCPFAPGAESDKLSSTESVTEKKTLPDIFCRTCSAGFYLKEFSTRGVRPPSENLVPGCLISACQEQSRNQFSFTGNQQKNGGTVSVVPPLGMGIRKFEYISIVLRKVVTAFPVPADIPDFRKLFLYRSSWQTSFLPRLLLLLLQFQLVQYACPKEQKLPLQF